MCKFCNDDLKERESVVDEMDPEDKIWLTSDNELVTNIVRSKDDYSAYFNINYCPLCGRSLE
ncbi:hypothetical protein LAX75_12950 [Listeria cossartiae]|uniref:hypothetical protein n=1 Tax=Listeria cossartiae TaxID=2838249 RepID=UPI001E460381|nr:hypothetical protein [Listeria cossartiae]MCD2225523.1 hypothetical protein [Listeria cossartiae]MCD2240274.1 hypothetical protein [Listeria cossartiae]